MYMLLGKEPLYNSYKALSPPSPASLPRASDAGRQLAASKQRLICDAPRELPSGTWLMALEHCMLAWCASSGAS